jgi:Uma2 family endonuclease
MATSYDETIVVPRAVRFPIELIPPEGFDPERLETWPQVVGRLEHVEGRLWFMPPCGDEQQDTVTDVVITLGRWVRSRRGFVLGTNEAGMRLRGATRAADAAVWRKSDAGSHTGGLRRRPPVLAVEVAGEDDTEELLRDKAQWYLEAGVAVVWIAVPRSRVVLVVSAEGERRCGRGERPPDHEALPGLEATVDELFLQLDG